MNMNEFQLADDRGRNKAIAYVMTITGLTSPQFEKYESPNGYDRTDLSMTAITSANTSYAFEVECKDRYDYTSIDFDLKEEKRFENNDGAIIDKDKYTTIVAKAKEENKVPVILMTYLDGVCLFFNLGRITKEDIKIENTSRKKTKINDNGSFKTTECCYLNKDKAKVAYMNDPHLYSWEDRISKAKEEYKIKKQIN